MPPRPPASRRWPRCRPAAGLQCPAGWCGRARATRLETPDGRGLGDVRQLAAEVARRVSRLDFREGGTSRTIVASLTADYPVENRLTIDELVSSERVAAATEPAALTAAGGLRGPVGVRYAIEGWARSTALFGMRWGPSPRTMAASLPGSDQPG